MLGILVVYAALGRLDCIITRAQHVRGVKKNIKDQNKCRPMYLSSALYNIYI